MATDLSLSLFTPFTALRPPAPRPDYVRFFSNMSSGNVAIPDAQSDMA